MPSESCNSRQLSWLMKSCFPDPDPDPDPISKPGSQPQRQSSISSLPDDLLLECLSRVPSSSLASLSLVCQRWSLLFHSSAFFSLRRSHRLLSHSLFSISLTHYGLFAATLRLPHDASWKTLTFPFPFPHLSHSHSHSRLSAIDREIYLIGRSFMLRFDIWTGTAVTRSPMIFPRKKFAVAAVSGKLYVAGGTAPTAAVEEYDPESDTWCVVTDAPRRRYGCIGASVDGVLYVIGGLAWGAGASVYAHASSMDLYDVEAGVWLRRRALPMGLGGCVVAACASGGHLYLLSSHAVELSFWRFDGRRRGGGFGEWCRLKAPPLAPQLRVDTSVRFSCVGLEDKVVLVQVMGCIDDLLRRSGRSIRGFKEGLVLVYDCVAALWSRAPDLPHFIKRASCVSLES